MEWFVTVSLTRSTSPTQKFGQMKRLKRTMKKKAFPLHDLKSKVDNYIIYGNATRTGGDEGIIASLVPSREA